MGGRKRWDRRRRGPQPWIVQIDGANRAVTGRTALVPQRAPGPSRVAHAANHTRRSAARVNRRTSAAWRAGVAADTNTPQETQEPTGP
jgi:hypothetical protein